MRERRVDVSFRDVTIARDGKRSYRVRVKSRTGSARMILGIWIKLVELRLDTKRDGWLSLARGGLGQVSHEMGGGGRWKSQNREIVPLSPCIEEPLNSKVISFVPELRSRYLFFEFRDSYVLCYVYINIPCTFRIFMYMVMVHLDTFFTAKKNVPFLFREETAFKDFLESKLLQSCHIDTNNLVNRWSKCIDVQGSYFDFWSGTLFWLVKTQFDFINSGLKVYSKIEHYFPNEQIWILYNTF